MAKKRVLVCLVFLQLLVSFSVLYANAASQGAAAISSGPAYSGNPKSMKYHNARCRYFSCKACTVRFSSPDEAEKKGYVACKVCGG